MGNQLTELYLALLDFVEPLRRRLTGPEALEYLFYRYGWNAAMDDAAFARIQQVAGVITPLNNFIQVAEPLRQQLEANPDAQLGAADALAQPANTVDAHLAAAKAAAGFDFAGTLVRLCVAPQTAPGRDVAPGPARFRAGHVYLVWADRYTGMAPR